ncbi:hypothetical protein ACN1NW_000446 [Acinetobacter baumannii]|nr:hypothetical protein [Acinetobacter baumannii]ELA7031030.1 hypothetical protein [Acinetobacter baumannii]ELA7118793.1 hypothetical protein [Acinetobacter baumannii]ELB0919742.1 hypothetical protein [Acinetobacter baumannii]ELB0965919.1 hypothetical protein [Acinetobacter baumannii]
MCLGCFIEDIKKSGLGEVVVLEMTKDGLRPADLKSTGKKIAIGEVIKAAQARGEALQHNNISNPKAAGIGNANIATGKVTTAEGKISNQGAGHSILTTPLPPKANFVALGGNTIKATNINTLDQAYTASEKMHRFVVPNLDELLLRTQASVGVLSGLSVHLNNGDEGKYSEEQYVKELVKLTALNFMSLQERGVALEDVVKAVTQTFEEMGTQTLRDEMTNFLKERGFATDVKAG